MKYVIFFQNILTKIVTFTNICVIITNTKDCGQRSTRCRHKCGCCLSDRLRGGRTEIFMKKITAVICVDDKMGMMFNHRRQSQDSALREWLVKYLDGRKMFMDTYTYGQFADAPPESVKSAQDDDYLPLMSDGDVCFTEKNYAALPAECDYILCRWNRRYPSDEKFTADPADYTIEQIVEIQGSSHDKITIEHWIFNKRGTYDEQ